MYNYRYQPKDNCYWWEIWKPLPPSHFHQFIPQKKPSYVRKEGFFSHSASDIFSCSAD